MDEKADEQPKRREGGGLRQSDGNGDGSPQTAMTRPSKQPAMAISRD